jgi:hypothetical protein
MDKPVNSSPRNLARLPKRRVSPVAVQSLENRLLLSTLTIGVSPTQGPTFATLNNGLLSIADLSSADAISVTDSAGSVSVALNGIAEGPFTSVTGIKVTADQNDDDVTLKNVPIQTTIVANGSGDTIVGGSDGTSIRGGTVTGDSVIHGGPAGNNTIVGGAGIDTISGNHANNTIEAGTGGGVIFAGFGSDSISGSVYTFHHPDSIYCGSSTDSIVAGSSDVILDTVPGDYIIIV